MCAAEDAPRLAGGVCSSIGCWTYIDYYFVEFDGQGVYGYNGTTLGEIELWLGVRFTGAASKTRPFQYESTRGVKKVRGSGERVYFSAAHPEGYPVSGGATFQDWEGGPYVADTLVDAFGFAGYEAYENSVLWAGVVHQWSWEDPSSAYPGTWYAWVKSPKFECIFLGNGCAYNTYDPPPMGAEWYGSGYDPS